MKKVLLLFVILPILMPSFVNAKKGCCSHHGGIDHCGLDGYYICEDSTESPSCTCTPKIITYDEYVKKRESSSNNVKVIDSQDLQEQVEKSCTCAKLNICTSEKDKLSVKLDTQKKQFEEQLRKSENRKDLYCILMWIIGISFIAYVICKK